MARKPKKQEQTTDIYFDDYYPTARITTYNYTLKKKLAKFAEEHPECCELKVRYSDSGVMYMVDKSRMSIRFLSPCSEDKKEMYRNILKSINNKEGDSM